MQTKKNSNSPSRKRNVMLEKYVAYLTFSKDKLPHFCINKSKKAVELN